MAKPLQIYFGDKLRKKLSEFAENLDISESSAVKSIVAERLQQK